MVLIPVDLSKKTDCNAKIKDIGDEIPDITNLLLLLLLLLLNIKYLTLMIWSKKQIKFQKYQKKYFTGSAYNKFTNNILNAKINEKKLMNQIFQDL